ncbi:MAG: menaquinone biosynthesis protein [Acidobacteria bacterium]|nr:menaquinone biosynthesis protein [Acidobacteriota bacterium]
MKPKVSFIEFLNSVPLGWGFLYGDYREAFEIIFDVPSECARHLAKGEADVGLIPVIEYQRIVGLRVLPGISIASKHEVKSVLFVSKVPLKQVRRVALDSSSRTSAALLQILLQKFHRMDHIEYTEEPPLADRMLEWYDAALLIGNPALQLPRQSLFVYDLAEQWNEFTGLPFVFAFWSIRHGVNLGELVQIFYESRRAGLNHIEDIARIYSAKLSVSAGEVRDYLLHNLNFSLDEENLRGLDTFYSLAAESGLISSVRPLEFYN